jgi:hypothetical protein
MRRVFTHTVTPTVFRSRVEIWPREMCWEVLFLLFDDVGVDGVNAGGCCAVRKHVVRRVEADDGAALS